MFRSYRVLIASVCAMLLSGCPPKNNGVGEKPTQCIQAPVLSDKSEEEKAAKVALDLAKLPVKAGIEGSFKRKAETAYQALSDDNVAMLILLNAIHCYNKQGDLGAESSKAMVEIVREMRLAHGGVKGALEVETLSIDEENLIRGDFESEIKKYLSELGVRIPA